MQDNRLYIIKPLSYWTSPRGKTLFNVKQSELDDAVAHPQGILREEEDRVLVVEQDAKAYIAKKAEEGKVSEVLKRHSAKVEARNKKKK